MNTAKHQPHFDRRARTQNEIKQLIAERNKVLSLYYNLTNHAETADSADIETLKDLLQEFCQDLIDYVATGHFEIYRRIEEGLERRNEIIELSNDTFNKIIDTTKAAVQFNDQYDYSEDINPDNLKEFPHQLSELGINLATRIELEDRFINTLLNPKPRLVYSSQ